LIPEKLGSPVDGFLFATVGFVQGSGPLPVMLSHKEWPAAQLLQSYPDPAGTYSPESEPIYFKQTAALATAQAPVPNDQYASSVIGFSSQYSSSSWSAQQALGAPNTFSYGDARTAWSSANRNADGDTVADEFLSVGFSDPTNANGIEIRETWGNGFVRSIDLLDINGTYHTVWTGTDTSQPGSPVDFRVNFTQTDYAVVGARINVDTDHNLSTWEEIDSVKLLGVSASQSGSYSGANLLSELKRFLPTLVDNVNNLINTDVLMGIPLLGNQLGSVNPLGSLFDGFKTQIQARLNSLPSSSSAAEVKQVLLDVLHSSLDLLRDRNGDNVIGLADIGVVEGVDAISFQLKLGKSASTSISIDERVALPALGLKLNGGVTPELAFSWNLDFGVDKNSGFFVSTNNPLPEIGIKLKTQLVDSLGKPLSLSGALGYLQLKAEDKGSLLQGDFSVDLRNPLSTLSAVPKFIGNLSLKLGLDASFGEAAKLPKIGTDFKLDWGFTATAGADEKVNGVYQGSKPTISFDNVNLDIGSFLQDFADPVFGTLNSILEPVRPLLKVVQTKIPIVDDFGAELFDQNGDGNVTLLDLALLVSPDSAQLGFISELTKVDQLTQAVQELTSTTSIPLVVGSFNLGNLDVRQSNFNLSTVDLASLAPIAKSANAILSEIGGLSVNGKPVSNFSSLISAASGNTTSNLPQFPILTDPSQVFRLLLGQDAEFFKYTLPPLSLTAQLDKFIPLFGPLGIQLYGNFDALAQVAVGFDSYGIRQYATQIGKGGATDPSLIYNGFYIDNSTDPQGPFGRKSGALINASFNASGGVNVVLASSGIGGGISSNLFLGINDPNNDGKLHLNEFDPGCIFDPVTGKISGVLNAYIKVGIGPFNVKKRFDIDEVTILDLSLGCTEAERARLAKESVLATLLQDRALSLNMGPTASQRLVNGINGIDDAESFTVDYAFGSPDNVTLIIGYSGIAKAYSNVNRIDAKGGALSDVITIDAKVLTPALLSGGNEGTDEHGDRLTGGSGNDTIQGENGDDVLYGGAGDDYLDGGNNDDVLNGGAGADTLDGGEDYDIASYRNGASSGIIIDSINGVLVGIQGDAIGDQLINIEEIEGTNFNDVLKGNDAENIFNGAGGNDTLEGGAGDDLLVGGLGADRLDGGTGLDWASYFSSNTAVNVNLATNIALGGDAAGDIFLAIENVAGSGFADTLIGSFDDNILEGFAGNDYLDGGAGYDTLKGGTGNDHLLTFDLGSADFLDGETGINRLSADYSDQIVNIIFLSGQKNDYNFSNGDTALNFQNLGNFYTGSGTDLIRLDGQADDGYNNILKTNAGSDIIYSGAGRDTIEAGSGDDFIDGGEGADSIDGGDGIDTLDYSKSSNSVIVDLKTGLTGGLVNAARTFDSVTNKYISRFVAASSTLSVLQMSKVTDFDGPLITTAAETIANIENVIGSRYNDTLIGDDRDNIFRPGLSRALPYDERTVAGTLSTITLNRAGYTPAGSVGITLQDFVDGGGGNDLLIVDYSIGDDAAYQGVTGGGTSGNSLVQGVGFIQRLPKDPQAANPEYVSFSNIERLHITATSKNDALSGLLGDDTFYGGAGDDFIVGASSNFSNIGNDVIFGGEGDDEIANRFYGFAGFDANLRDQFDGGSGFDTLSADFSNQTADIVFISGQSNDIVFADGTYAKNFEYLRNFTSGSGNDLIIQRERLSTALYNLSSVENRFFAGAGNDTINSGVGADVVDGGEGDDLLILDYSLTDDVTTGPLTGFTFGTGSTGLVSSASYQRKGENGVALDSITASNIERYQITGTSKNDSFSGWHGNDVFKGLAGNDTITGFGGNDQFIFASGRSFVSVDLGIDTIADFEVGKDRLILDPLTFTAGLSFANVATDSDVASNSAFIVYSRATGNLFYNENGIAADLGSGGQFAILGNKATLGASDFGSLPKLNNPPVIVPISKGITKNFSLTFQVTDFSNAFADPDADPLARIQIASLPSNGTLRINGGSVAQGQQINAADLSKLSYSPNLDFVGTDSFGWIGVDPQGSVSAVVAVTVTVNPPTLATAVITGVADDQGLIQDTVAANGRTNDITPTITGRISTALAAGETLRVYNGDTLLGSAAVNNKRRTWSYTPALPPTAGTTYSINARVADAAGNLGPESPARVFTLDTSSPTTTAAITDVTDNVGLIQGTVAANGRTDDLTPTITGRISTALATGETLRIYNGDTLLGSAAVNNKRRTWSYTPTLPPTGGTTYSITARVADAAGNLGPASPPRVFTLDTASPTITAFSPLDGAAGVAQTANITLTFSESMRRGTGAIELRLGSADGALVESFDAITSSKISISGNQITLDPTADLAPNTQYFLTLPAGSFTDLAGNAAAAISTYDFRTINAVSGTSANNTLSFTDTVDQLTGLESVDRFRLSSLQRSLLPADSTTPIDRITDLVTGEDRIDAPVARPLAQAVAPLLLGSVSALNATAISALLTPAAFPAFTTTSTGGVAAFSFNDPTAGSRTFLAINNDVAGFQSASDAILEITGYSGNLSSLQVY
jgi:Ca2+-binding RTX toxin-like protein